METRYILYNKIKLNLYFLKGLIMNKKCNGQNRCYIQGVHFTWVLTSLAQQPPWINGLTRAVYMDTISTNSNPPYPDNLPSFSPKVMNETTFIHISICQINNFIAIGLCYKSKCNENLK